MTTTNQQTTPKLNASSRIMYEEAQKRGITCSIFGDQQTILMEQNGKQWYVRGSRTSFQSSVGKTIADKKDLTKKILHHFNLPTAKHAVVSKSEHFSLLEKLTFPLVMKPLSERHGKGVVVGIKSINEAKEYWQAEQQKMLFEEMLVGTEYRVVCVDFKFIAAAFRKPAFVTGDGIHSIENLIMQKNEHPWRGKGHIHNLTLIEVDEMVLDYLKEQRYTLSDIPPAGTEVFLRRTANLSTGGEAWDITDEVSPENQQLFEKIARACDLNVIGIDIMCNSLATPIVEQNKAGVIEVNASPGLRMHHYPIEGKPRNVAAKILESILTKLELSYS